MIVEFAQLLGTAFVVGLGIFGLYVVAERQRWCDYGRETLFWFAVSQFWFAFFRTLSILGVIDAQTQRTANGLGAAITFTIVLNLVVMHIVFHRHGLANESNHPREVH